MPWIDVDGRSVHINTGGRKLTKRDESALRDFARSLSNDNCEHIKSQQRLRDGSWVCSKCDKEVGDMSDFTSEQPGAFIIEAQNGRQTAWLVYNCPCGCGTKGHLSLIRGLNTPHGNYVWAWDNDMRTPTLAPSIRRIVECKFHGHLQKGIWTACDDSVPVSPKVWKP